MIQHNKNYMQCDLSTVEYTGVEVCTFHDGCKQGIDQQIFNRKSFHVKLHILGPHSNRSE